MTDRRLSETQRPKVGDHVFCEVQWPGGRKTQTEGKLIVIRDNLAYVETSMGVCEVDLATVEPA